MSTIILPLATRLGRTVTYLEELFTIKSFNAHLTFQGYETKKYHYISTTRVSMATKIKKMITYLDRLLAIKAHDS